MENSKISLVDLAKALAKRKKLSQRESEAFVRAFFELIQEQLLAGETVKIKGLGTFKITEVGSRESVNINTGERIVIEGHSKVSFTPDKTMADHVNRPFVDFQTVVINDNVSTEDMERIDAPVVEPTEEELPPAEEAPEETPAEEAPEETPIVENAPQEEVVAPVASVAAISVEDAPAEEVPIEEAPVDEEVMPIEELPSVEENTAEEETEPVAGEDTKEETNPRKRRIWLWILCFLLLLALACGAYYYYNYIYKPASQESETPRVQPTENVVPADTIRENDTTAIEPVVEEPQTPKYNLDSIRVRYAQIENGEYWIVGTKTIHELEKGEDLSKLADRYYGDKRLISYIIKHNHYRNSDLERMFVGKKVEIPELVKRDELK